MLNINGNVFLKTAPTVEEGKDFATCLVRDGKAQYKCYFFDHVKEHVIEKGYKGGDYVNITAKVDKSKPQYLISPKKWKEIAPKQKNPTLFSSMFLKVTSIEPAVPDELEQRYQKKAEGKRKVLTLNDIE
ncbi:MAG: hypothetical protein E7272_07705 [Pseudobutyrivibrio ruminis]|uniref:Uncharacterized protein n=1 Tax=Pseudobutyrivibrio ruminis TaxID=46206 RepID=A0A927U9Q4_9FIRM|nr:hypothetical protein [Pseudobutyrivibrio ruminis]